MKNPNLVSALLIVTILAAAVGVSAVTPPTDLSLRGIVEWVAVGGHVASGTTLPTVGPVGTRFTRLSAPTKPVDYRSTGTSWYPMWTWNHRDLTNLSYDVSGHGIVPFSFGGTGATSPVSARDNLDVYSTTEVDNKIANTFGTMASETATTYLKVADLPPYPTNASFTLAGLSEKSYWSLADRPTFGTMASETATDYLKVADLPAYPANASFTLAGLSEKSYWSLTGLPTFGTMASETATDYLKVVDLPPIPNNASFTFAGLSDVPTYTSQAGKVLKVNATEDGIEWGTGGGGTTLPEYSGYPDRALSLASDGETLYWQTVHGFKNNVASRAAFIPSTWWDAISSWTMPVPVYPTLRRISNLIYSIGAYGTWPFAGGTVLPDGKVFLLQENSNFSLLYDPPTHAIAVVNFGLTTDNLFDCPLIATNGTIICTPCFSDYVGLVDYPGLYYRNGPAHGKVDYGFRGGCMMLNGEALFSPSRSANIGLFDPFTETYTDGPAHGEGDYAFSGAVLISSGTVVLVPNNSDYVGLYNPVTNTYTRGPAHGEGDSSFERGVYLPDGRVLLVPHSSDYIGLYDPVANTYTRGPSPGTTDTGFMGGTLLQTGTDVYLCPYSNQYHYIYNIASNTCTAISAALGAGPNFMESILLPTGNILVLPANRDSINLFYTASSPVSIETCISPWVNTW